MRERIRWIDIAKGILILLVLVGHTISNPSLARHLIFSFHMPAFFFLAGWTFRPGDASCVKKAFNRLLVPYLLLALVWNVPQALMNNETISIEAIVRLVGAIFFASGTDITNLVDMPSIGMAWFLAAMFASRVIFNGLQNLASKHSLGNAGQSVIYGTMAAMGLACFDAGVALPLSLDICLITVPLMWCGKLCSKTKLPKKSPAVALGIAFIWLALSLNSNLELAARSLQTPVVALMAAIAGTFMVCELAILIDGIELAPLSLVPQALEYLGKNSLSLYAIHAVDWFIPWQTFAALSHLPLSRALASAVRIACDTALMMVVKKR